LMFLKSMLESVCTGDESELLFCFILWSNSNSISGFQLRRQHGDVIVCAIAAGLHR
jgi:hypothetical protein